MVHGQMKSYDVGRLDFPALNSEKRTPIEADIEQFR